jgi:hypothetical protein
VAGDVVDVPQARGADLGSFGVAAEPAGAGLVGSAGDAGEQGDAVFLEVAAVISAGDAEPQERHGADVAADLAFDACFLAGALAGRPVAVKPGSEQVIRQAVAASSRKLRALASILISSRCFQFRFSRLKNLNR